jgi:hypothetical protein
MIKHRGNIFIFNCFSFTYGNGRFTILFIFFKKIKIVNKMINNTIFAYIVDLLQINI